jgi:hypothetical protein
MFRKKPVVIEAWKMSDGGIAPPGAKIRHAPAVEVLSMETTPSGAVLQVYDTLHDTWVTFEYGDWIIKGVKGEFYPCKSDVFEQSYEGVSHALL